MSRMFDPLPEPATLRERFTPKGRIRKAYGGRTSFQVSAQPDGSARIWTIGPLGWWHDFQTIPAGTSFDDALARTHIPAFYGWDREGAGRRSRPRTTPPAPTGRRGSMQCTPERTRLESER